MRHHRQKLAFHLRGMLGLVARYLHSVQRDLQLAVFGCEFCCQLLDVARSADQFASQGVASLLHAHQIASTRL